MAEATKQHATGRIEVDSYEPKPSDESTDGPALVEVDVCETFIGDIEGAGVGRFLQAQRHDGSASFVGGRERLRGEGGFTADLGSEAAAFSDVLVLAVPFAAIDEAMPSDGELAGKIVWSCVNALKPNFSGLAVGVETSATEEVASRAPRARVVEAIPPFASAIAAGSLPYDHGLRPSVFVAGDDAGAKREVERLIEEPRDIGLRLLERTSG